METIDGKVSNTTKGMNIATEFNELKNTLFNKKIIKHKREFKAKNIKWEHKKSTKYHYSVFIIIMTRDLFQMMVFILLLIFIKT